MNAGQLALEVERVLAARPAKVARLNRFGGEPIVPARNRRRARELVADE